MLNIVSSFKHTLYIDLLTIVYCIEASKTETDAEFHKKDTDSLSSAIVSMYIRMCVHAAHYSLQYVH